jgi:hypothetical protein
MHRKNNKEQIKEYKVKPKAEGYEDIKNDYLFNVDMS